MLLQSQDVVLNNDLPKDCYYEIEARNHLKKNHGMRKQSHTNDLSSLELKAIRGKLRSPHKIPEQKHYTVGQ